MAPFPFGARKESFLRAEPTAQHRVQGWMPRGGYVLTWLSKPGSMPPGVLLRSYARE
jgi:hypothetical protein